MRRPASFSVFELVQGCPKNVGIYAVAYNQQHFIGQSCSILARRGSPLDANFSNNLKLSVSNTSISEKYSINRRGERPANPCPVARMMAMHEAICTSAAGRRPRRAHPSSVPFSLLLIRWLLYSWDSCPLVANVKV